MASYRPLGERPTLEKCLIWGTHTINESASGNRLRKAGAFLVWIFKAENPCGRLDSTNAQPTKIGARVLHGDLPLSIENRAALER
jgi:hypothetical protein